MSATLQRTSATPRYEVTPAGRPKRTPGKPRAVAGRPAADAAASRALGKLAHDYFEFLMHHRPDFATYVGRHELDGRLPDLGPKGRAREASAMRRILAGLGRICIDRLSGEDRLTHSALEEVARVTLADQEHALYQWEVDQLGGPQVWFLEILNVHPLESERDYEHLLERMDGFGEMMCQYLGNLNEGLREGRTAPLVGVVRVIDQLQTVLATPTAEHPLHRACDRMPASWPAARQAKLARRIDQAIEARVTPSLASFLELLEKDYVPHARQTPGIHAMKGGRATYRHCIWRHTTTHRTPEEIHAIGLEEVAQIGAQIRSIARRLGHTGPMRPFFDRLRTDPANLARGPKQLVARYERDIARANALLPQWFGLLPHTPCVVKPVDPFRQKSAPAGYYYGPSQDGSRPGVFYANTYQACRQPLHGATALTVHEAIPGHHLQVALATELKSLPLFRRWAFFNAYTEGWALYAERLADEMGLYTDDRSRIGMLTEQCWRACRLVVDTGLHAKGWSRQKAIDYMTDRLASSETQIAAEVDRYIVWPGQALAYKIGQREILALRERATRTLGTRFDIRAFHDQILGHGALPLNTLRLAVEDWVRSARAS